MTLELYPGLSIWEISEMKASQLPLITQESRLAQNTGTINLGDQHTFIPDARFGRSSQLSLQGLAYFMAKKDQREEDSLAGGNGGWGIRVNDDSVSWWRNALLTMKLFQWIIQDNINCVWMFILLDSIVRNPAITTSVRLTLPASEPLQQQTEYKDVTPRRMRLKVRRSK